jgi:hypothetical protein
MLARNLFAVGIIALFGVIVLTMVDFQMQQLEKVLSSKQIESIGEMIGKLAVPMVFAAILYYLVREAFVMARAKQFKLSVWLDGNIVRFIGWLRLLHPLVGLLTASLVLLHGYLMWWVWAAGNFGAAVISGMAAGALLALLLLTGMLIRLMPKRVSLRFVHRWHGVGFIGAMIVHRVLAD